MEIIRKVINEEMHIPEAIKPYINKRKFCFIDIETTGLSRYRDSIILVGLLYVEENSINIIQLFANNRQDEKELLEKLIKIASTFQVFITYNGDSFDIPFINNRLKINNINYSIDVDSIDLLRIVRKHKDTLSLENCKLKTVERRLGIEREDKISGKESVDLYFNYLDSKDERLRHLILQHNYDDIYYLSKILTIYDVIENLTKSTLKFSYNNNYHDLVIDQKNITINGNMLNVIASTSKSDMPDQVYFGESYSLEWCPTSGMLSLELQVYDGNLSNGSKCFYLNKCDYPVDIDLIDSTPYKVASQIVLVKEEKTLFNSNVEGFIGEFMSKINLL